MACVPTAGVSVPKQFAPPEADSSIGLALLTCRIRPSRSFGVSTPNSENETGGQQGQHIEVRAEECQPDRRGGENGKK